MLFILIRNRTHSDFGLNDPQKMNQRGKLKLNQTSLTQTTSFKMLNVKIEAGFVSCVKFYIWLGLPNLGVQFFAYFDKMTYKT